MVKVREEYYFNGNKVLKQTLNKYIIWEKVLSAIINGTDTGELLKERLAKCTSDMLIALKREGMIVGSNSTKYATYTVTEKGVNFINEVKQYQKEKKDEERRMFGNC